MRPKNLCTSPWLELKGWGPLQQIKQMEYVLWREVSLGYLTRLGINQSLSRNLKFELQLMNLTIRLNLALWLSFITLTGGSLPLTCIRINKATPNPLGRPRHRKIMQTKEASELKSPSRMRKAWPKGTSLWVWTVYSMSRAWQSSIIRLRVIKNILMLMRLTWKNFSPRQNLRRSQPWCTAGPSSSLRPSWAARASRIPVRFSRTQTMGCFIFILMPGKMTSLWTSSMQREALRRETLIKLGQCQPPH